IGFTNKTQICNFFLLLRNTITNSGDLCQSSLEAVHLGDIFAIGTAEVQVTQPRVPCFKLGVKLEDPKFVGVFLRSGRTGFYLRVLKEGSISAGDKIVKRLSHPAPISILEAMKCLIPSPDQRPMIERVLANEALSLAWRLDLQNRLSS
ncbi:MAG: MOSC domain-containing protein, partial [Gammaproteobacteria bacterium]|nr:MOSC domain-containing protein [Gammaproteobacteria bacterium]